MHADDQFSWNGQSNARQEGIHFLNRARNRPSLHMRFKTVFWADDAESPTDQ